MPSFAPVDPLTMHSTCSGATIATWTAAQAFLAPVTILACDVEEGWLENNPALVIIDKLPEKARPQQMRAVPHPGAP